MKLRSFLHHLNRRDTRLIPKFSPFVKIILIALIAVSSIFFARHLFAQSSELRYQIDSNAAGGNMEAWMGSSFSANAFQILNGITGVKDIPPAVLSSIEKGQPVAYGTWAPGGILGKTNSMIASLYYPQASGIEYLAQIKDNFLGKPAYAQGAGFTGLQPLLPLWRGFRNMVYVLSSLIFITIGVMIMLRVKISPQAVITIQNAIPQLITTLILVTFSYAIAGLLIDLMYLFSAIILAMLFSAKGVPFGDNFLTFRPITNTFNPVAWVGNLIQAAYQQIPALKPFTLEHLTNPSWVTVQNLTYHALPTWALFSLSGLISATVLGTLGGGILNIAAGGAGNDLGRIAFGTVGGLVGGTLGGILISLIISIIVIFWLIKLYFGLIKAYVTIIFKIIIAPLEIGIGAFPGAKGGFSSWIFDLLSNIAVFPITMLFLVMLNYLSESLTANNSTAIWAPGMISMGFTNVISNNAIVQAAIGLAGLGILSKLPDLVPQVIFALKPSPWMQATNQSYDFSRSGAYKFGVGAAKAAVIGPAIDQFGENLSNDKGKTANWINSHIRVGRAKQPIGDVIGSGVQEIGKNIGAGKL